MKQPQDSLAPGLVDEATLQWAINKCLAKAHALNRGGCFGQARVAEELAASFKSKLSNSKRASAPGDEVEVSREGQ